MMPFYAALVADALLMLYAGYKDLKEFSVPTPLFVASLASLVALAFMLTLLVSPLLPAVLLASVILSLALVWKGLLGLGDLSVYTRYLLIVSALVLMGRSELAVLNTVALTVAILIYYYTVVRPMLCYPRFTGVAYVKREHFMNQSVIPVGVKVETDDAVIEKVKERILTEKKDVCLKARIGYPLIGLYSLAYSLTVALLVLFY